MTLSQDKRSRLSFAEKVYKTTARVPMGKVATYAAIAYAIGHPFASRAVGNALNKNPYKGVPCHRVVRADGSVGGYAYGTNKKISRLAGEGVEIKNGIINLKQFANKS